MKMKSSKDKIIKQTLISALGAASGGFIVALIAVLLGHPSAHDAMIAIFGSIGIGIGMALVIGLPLSWFINTKLINLYAKTTGIKSISESPSMKISIEYNLQIDDVIAFYIFNQEQSLTLGSARKIMRYFLLIVFFLEVMVVITLLAVLGREQLQAALFIATLALLTLLYYLFFNILSRKIIKGKMVKNHLQKPNKLVGKHSLSISPEFISDATDVGESSISWRAVEYVASTKQYLFIVVIGSEPYIVPEKAFPDEAAFQQFIKLTETYYAICRPADGM